MVFLFITAFADIYNIQNVYIYHCVLEKKKREREEVEKKKKKEEKDELRKVEKQVKREDRIKEWEYLFITIVKKFIS